MYSRVSRDSRVSRECARVSRETREGFCFVFDGLSDEDGTYPRVSPWCPAGTHQCDVSSRVMRRQSAYSVGVAVLALICWWTRGT